MGLLASIIVCLSCHTLHWDLFDIQITGTLGIDTVSYSSLSTNSLLLFITEFTCCYLLQASNHNDAGDYERAKSFGNAALGCNLCVFIYYVLLILAFHCNLRSI